MYRVIVVTGTRAEYGLLRPVLKQLFAAPDISTALWVTGTHLSSRFGYTVGEIEKDGLPIARRLDYLAQPVPEGRSGTAWRTSTVLHMFLKALEEEPQKPDALLVLGDRYEIFAAGQAAALLDIPVVHISGGDVTQGADDDWFRHCLTKMAKLHFPSCALYRQRVIRMGEQPSRVFNVGGLGDENIRSMPLLDKTALAQSLELAFGLPDVLVTYHPETATGASVRQQAEALLGAVQDNPQLNYLFTAANADAGGEEFNGIFEDFCARQPNAAMVYSLGAQRYLSAMKQARLVLGNSSSGVVETPSFGTPAVNIGNRQDGRLMCENVVCCAATRSSIAAAMQTALSPAFAAEAAKVISPYNGGDTSGKIVMVLHEFLKSDALRAPKIFYDVPEVCE